jgi:uncharacterized protein (TIGR02453 family)
VAERRVVQIKAAKAARVEIRPETHPRFSEESLKFLRGLKRNNRRDWFDPRKPLFESTLKAPLLRVIEGVTADMMDFSPEHVRPAPKIMMRIYRDTRFSNDKTPYKTRVAGWWSRHGLEKTSGGGYYMHFAADELVIAAGVYMPERDQLMAIRNFLLTHHVELRKLLQDKKLLRLFTLDNGQALTRPPKGFPADHPAIDLLKYRQWAVFAKLPVEEALSPKLVKTVADHFRAAEPLVRLLNEPLVAAPKPDDQRMFGLY